MQTVLLVAGTAIGLFGLVLIVVAWRKRWSRSGLRLGASQLAVGLLLIIGTLQEGPAQYALVGLVTVALLTTIVATRRAPS